MTVLDYASAPTSETDSAHPRGHWLGWAVYLAMSWTWCIGMFLPVLLVRDYGIWGFVIFAVPNVIGAAAMGWVLRSRHDSLAIQASHRSAILGFALTTSAFQIFFACWILPWVALTGIDLAKAVPLIALLMIVSVSINVRTELTIGWIILFLTAALLAGVLGDQSPRFPSMHRLMESPPLGLVFLSPVIVFGFLLCPYLDPTFHHARQRLNRRAAAMAFGVGFGVVFAAALLCVLAYSRAVETWLLNVPRLSDSIFARCLGLFFVGQLSFTVAMHWWRGSLLGDRARLIRGAVLISASFALGVGSWLGTRYIDRPWIEAGETIYRLFMGFYGLVFPAYVWLCMIPSPRAKPSRRSVVVFVAAVAVAAPMFWMGFIEGRMIWLLPGLAVVLLARCAVPRYRPQAPQRPSGP